MLHSFDPFSQTCVFSTQSVDLIIEMVFSDFESQFDAILGSSFKIIIILPDILVIL